MHNREEEGKHEESSAYVNPCSPEKKKKQWKEHVETLKLNSDKHLF